MNGFPPNDIGNPFKKFMYKFSLGLLIIPFNDFVLQRSHFQNSIILILYSTLDMMRNLRDLVGHLERNELPEASEVNRRARGLALGPGCNRQLAAFGNK